MLSLGDATGARTAGACLEYSLYLALLPPACWAAGVSRTRTRTRIRTLTLTLTPNPNPNPNPTPNPNQVVATVHDYANGRYEIS